MNSLVETTRKTPEYNYIVLLEISGSKSIGRREDVKRPTHILAFLGLFLG